MTPEPHHEHELGAKDNAVFAGLSGTMRFVAIFLAVFGVLLSVIGFGSLSMPLDAVLDITEGLALLVIALLTFSAGGSFQRVVDTEGHDITNVMRAVAKLRYAYALQSWLWILVAVLTVAEVVLAKLR
jgi:hypothetical protein